MAKVDYATLKKGGFMRQKQKNNFSLRLACVGGALSLLSVLNVMIAPNPPWNCFAAIS